MVIPSIDRDKLADAEYYLTNACRNFSLPGLAVAIVQGSEVIYSSGFGAAAPGRPVTPQTPFILGSLSKSFTALAVMQLVEQGKVKLDASVQTYIPWFYVTGHNGSVSGDNLSAQVTVRHLLCHISGLPRYEGRDLLSGKGGKMLEQVVRGLRFVKLIKPIGITEPVGGEFQYSNLNYAVLGLLVEVVSGQSYGSYIEEHISRPLHMHTSFTSEPVAVQHGLSQGHRWWFGFPVPFHAPYLEEAIPAAFVISSAQDMAKYLIACLEQTDTLLSREGFRELFGIQGIMHKSKDNFNYAFGWRVGMYEGEEMLRHGGEVSNFRADMVLLPGRNLGVVVFANANNGMIAQLGLDQIALPVMRILMGLPLTHKKLTFRSFYSLIDALVIVASLLQFASMVQLLRSFSRRPARVGGILATMIEVIGSLVVLTRLPKWVDMPWRGLRLYVPDVSRWLVGMIGVSLFKGCLRLYQVLLKERRDIS